MVYVYVGFCVFKEKRMKEKKKERFIKKENVIYINIYY